MFKEGIGNTKRPAQEFTSTYKHHISQIKEFVLANRWLTSMLLLRFQSVRFWRMFCASGKSNLNWYRKHWTFLKILREFLANISFHPPNSPDLSPYDFAKFVGPLWGDRFESIEKIEAELKKNRMEQNPFNKTLVVDENQKKLPWSRKRASIDGI